MSRHFITWALLGLLLPTLPARADDALRDRAAKALRQAADFFRTQVAVEGGYLWRYGEDLRLREGERKAAATQAWVQPPGTPSVGTAFLRAYEATGDVYYLDAAKETAYALVRGQLRSGGWDYHIEFDPKLRPPYAYRVGGSEKGRDVTTLDDDTTQSAVRFLMQVDRARAGRRPAAHPGRGRPDEADHQLSDVHHERRRALRLPGRHAVGEVGRIGHPAYFLHHRETRENGPCTRPGSPPR